MIRKGVYSIQDVLSKIVPVDTPDKESYVEFDSEFVRMNSKRYELFAAKGVTCVKCGLQGIHFVLERDEKVSIGKFNGYHFNLYAINQHGHEVLMTRDHIIPKSKNGLHELNNFQVMCCRCNFKKGNKIEQSETAAD